MPSVRIAVTFTAEAAQALRRELGAGGLRPRAMFTLEPLHASGKLPDVGDLVADLRLAPRVWRVQQRSVLVDANADATISLLVGEAAGARLTCDPHAERVQLTEHARAAVFAEHVGREQPDECRVLMAALSAAPPLHAATSCRTRAGRVTCSSWRSGCSCGRRPTRCWCATCSTSASSRASCGNGSRDAR
jgi:hypothetical protein